VLKVWGATEGMVVSGPDTGITFTATGAVVSGGSFALQPEGCSGDLRRVIDVAASALVTKEEDTCQ